MDLLDQCFDNVTLGKFSLLSNKKAQLVLQTEQDTDKRTGASAFQLSFVTHFYCFKSSKVTMQWMCLCNIEYAHFVLISKSICILILPSGSMMVASSPACAWRREGKKKL